MQPDQERGPCPPENQRCHVTFDFPACFVPALVTDSSFLDKAVTVCRREFGGRSEREDISSTCLKSNTVGVRDASCDIQTNAKEITIGIGSTIVVSSHAVGEKSNAQFTVSGEIQALRISIHHCTS